MRPNARQMTQRPWLAVVLLAAVLSLVGGCRSGDRSPGQITDDLAIQTAVVSRLLADPQVAGMKIRTKVYVGVVTLYGGVPDEKTRQVALALARDVKGVVQVEDRLTVTGP